MERSPLSNQRPDLGARELELSVEAPLTGVRSHGRSHGAGEESEGRHWISSRILSALTVLSAVALLVGGAAVADRLMGPEEAAPARAGEEEGGALVPQRFFAGAGEELIGDDCGNSMMLNDFSSKVGMETAGWWFNWTDDFTFKPLMYKDFVPPNSFWGFMMKGIGGISLRVRGEGMLTLDFGNVLGTEGSKVSVYLNLQEQAYAGPSVLSQTVELPYHDSDSLLIAQDTMGIIVINRISFVCQTTTTMPETTTTADTVEEQKIADAEKDFKREHAKLQETAELEEKKEQERYAALKLEEAQEKLLKQEKEREKQVAEGKDDGSDLDAAEQNKNTDKLVEALMDVLGSNEHTDDEGGDSGKHTGEESDSGTGSSGTAGAKDEEQLAKELERETKHSSGDHDEATGKDEKAEERKKAGEAHNKTESKHNSTQVKEMLKTARKQAEKADKELKQAQEVEDMQEKKSSEAATLMADAIQLKKEKDEERARMKTLAEEESNTAVAPTTTTTPLTVPSHVSLYCFTLMLPFGYEPTLLTAQKRRKVGFYRCDEFTVFSNSSVLLDTGKPTPVAVELLDFSLAVQYGGKWHTALNTPVFNRIWAKVRDMGIYLSYAWTVKADIDTVWFPERLRRALSSGMPAGAIAQPTGRRMAGNDMCKHCKLKGLEADMCEDHVRWLQKHKNKSCDEALELTARPPPVDCGCACSKVEVCDLSADPDAWLDGHYIKGDLMAAMPAVYINNCRFGLHGPIEVLSAGAITAFVEGLPQCEFLLSQPWGEDKYLDRCMIALGVTRVNLFDMLSEIACGEEPAPCGKTSVAFHPFKKTQDYFACWAFANSFGHGPFEEKDGDESSEDGDDWI